MGSDCPHLWSRTELWITSGHPTCMAGRVAPPERLILDLQSGDIRFRLDLRLADRNLSKNPHF